MWHYMVLCHIYVQCNISRATKLLDMNYCCPHEISIWTNDLYRLHIKLNYFADIGHDLNWHICTDNSHRNKFTAVCLKRNMIASYFMLCTYDHALMCTWMKNIHWWVYLFSFSMEICTWLLDNLMITRCKNICMMYLYRRYTCTEFTESTIT